MTLTAVCHGRGMPAPVHTVNRCPSLPFLKDICGIWWKELTLARSGGPQRSEVAGQRA